VQCRPDYNEVVTNERESQARVKQLESTLLNSASRVVTFRRDSKSSSSSIALFNFGQSRLPLSFKPSTTTDDDDDDDDDDDHIPFQYDYTAATHSYHPLPLSLFFTPNTRFEASSPSHPPSPPPSAHTTYHPKHPVMNRVNVPAQHHLLKARQAAATRAPTAARPVAADTVVPADVQTVDAAPAAASPAAGEYRVSIGTGVEGLW
jgi:hypothetical protein